MRNNVLRKAGWVAAGVLMLCTACRMSAQQPAKPAEPAQSTGAAKAPEPAKPAEYVGSETCKACHEEIYNNLQKSPHFAIETGARKGWAQKSCESCHGPGAKHAESASADDIRNPAKLAPLE